MSITIINSILYLTKLLHIHIVYVYGAVSSGGRAPALQAGGHWFDPNTAHFSNKKLKLLGPIV